MIVKLGQIIKQYRKTDRALLFLRLYLCFMLCVSISKKLIGYGNSEITFPPLLFDSSFVSFIFLTTIEISCAIMIALGLWLRFGAFILLMGVVVDIVLLYPAAGWFAVRFQILFGGIYIFLILCGGGKYALDNCFSRNNK